MLLVDSTVNDELTVEVASLLPHCCSVESFSTASRAHLQRAKPTRRADLAKDAQAEHGERERAGAVPCRNGKGCWTLAAGGGAAWPTPLAR